MIKQMQGSILKYSSLFLLVLVGFTNLYAQETKQLPVEIKKTFIGTGTPWSSSTASDNKVYVSLVKFEDKENGVICYVAYSELNAGAISLRDGGGVLPAPSLQCIKKN